jgi:hypothetical protein
MNNYKRSAAYAVAIAILAVTVTLSGLLSMQTVRAAVAASTCLTQGSFRVCEGGGTTSAQSGSNTFAVRNPDGTGQACFNGVCVSNQPTH